MAKKASKNKRTKDKLHTLIVGLSLVAVGLLFVYRGYNPINNFLKDSFADEPVKAAGFLIKDVGEEKLPSRIIIPKVAIDLPVKKATIVNGYWEVFTDMAGWGDGSGIPGDTRRGG